MQTYYYYCCARARVFLFVFIFRCYYDELLIVIPMSYALCVLMLLINLLLLYLLSQVASGGLSYYSDLWSAVCGMVP